MLKQTKCNASDGCRVSRGGQMTGRAMVALMTCHLVLGLLVTPPRTADGQEAGIRREYTIKLAYLYNFAKYVEWPSDGNPGGEEGAFVIGVVGPSPFGDALASLRTKTVRGSPIRVQQILAVSDYQPCHIVFFSAGSEESLAAAVLEATRASPTLTVGETKGFATNGGTLNFYKQQNKVRFELNRGAAQRAELKISSKLLRIAKFVPAPRQATRGQ